MSNVATRFEVFLEATRAGASLHQQGPQDVSLAEALDWARERADWVSVQIEGGAHFFSAGSVRKPADPPLPEPLPVLRSRPEGTPWDGSQQETTWPVDFRVITRQRP